MPVILRDSLFRTERRMERSWKSLFVLEALLTSTTVPVETGNRVDTAVSFDAAFPLEAVIAPDLVIVVETSKFMLSRCPSGMNALQTPRLCALIVNRAISNPTHVKKTSI